MPPATPRIGMIGCGAMGQALRAALLASQPSIPVGAVLTREEAVPADPSLQQFRDIRDFIRWRPTLVVECAGHEAVKEAVPELLRSGIDVVMLSIGALADQTVFDHVTKSAEAGNARMIAATGAIGGIDALRSARAAGLTRVSYTGRKPPAAWAGSIAEQSVDLSRLTQATAIFEGDAATAARLFPKNANVTAAVALAGIGFARTRVRLIAEPGISRNLHEIEAAGAFGTLRVALENEALPDNPRTSWLAALNAEYLVRREIGRLEF